MDQFFAPYHFADIEKIRGSTKIDHSLAKMGAERLRHLLKTENYVAALGALTGHQAVQQVQAGLKAIYCSGWQVAGDANIDGETYPDQSLYSAISVPTLVERINNALIRADEKQQLKGEDKIHWFAPIVADAEAGFGGSGNVFELMKKMIRAGAAGVHFEDQLSSEKKCGHLGGKVVIPTHEFTKKLIAARLAADRMEVPTILIARTDANSAKLIANDVDSYDHPFIIRERTDEGFYRFKGGLEAAIARGLAYAPYADLIWCETSKPDLEEARNFAKAIHEKFPGKLLAYNCSPSFNWQTLDNAVLLNFQKELAAMDYKFQFVTLAGFHVLNLFMFLLARDYKEKGMAAYAELQKLEFEAEKFGYEAMRHQGFVGTEYFDEIARIVSGGTPSTLAMRDSTEKEQF